MNILGWKAQGLRCPDHDIECTSQGKPLPITLIQMPNGTGKTTTLSLLRMALSGSANKWTREQIDEYKKAKNPQPFGYFKLRLKLNNRQVTIIMEFDFDSGRIEYKTTRQEGQVIGFDPPIEFRRFMNEEFVKFFVFDGELADNILSREKTDAQNAVESLFQIHLLEKMKKKVGEYWDEKTSGRGAKGEKGHKQRTNILKSWRDRLEKLTQKEYQFQRELKSVCESLESKNTLYNSEIEKNEEKKNEISAAEDELKEIESRVKESAQSVLDSLRDPYSISQVFATNIFDLKMGLERLKLPGDVAKEFFVELANDSECVCGRPIDKEIKNEIEKRAQRYLGSDDVSLLNGMKTAIDEAVGHSCTQPERLLSDVIIELSKLVDDQSEASNGVDELKHDAEQSNPKLKRAKEEIDLLTYKRDELRKKLKIINTLDDKVNFEGKMNIEPNRICSIETIKEGIKYFEERVDEVEKTLELRNKRDTLINVFTKAHAMAKQNITIAIKDQTNKRIAELMPDNLVRVKEINQCVVLEGQSSGSAGENLSISYAFLATLFNRSGEHKLPFIVDSPANPIDNEIRPKIGKLVPILADQFIAFVISSERQQFLSALRKVAGHEIMYITLFRKGITHHEKKAKKCAGYSSTEDGIMVAGEEYFCDFQLDSEGSD